MTAQKKIIKHLYKNQLGINNSNYHLPSFKTFLPSNSTESFQDVVSNGNMFYLDNGLSSVETLNFFFLHSEFVITRGYDLRLECETKQFS